MKNLMHNRSVWTYRAMLILAAALWGLGFGIGKSAIEQVGATWFTCIRFLGAGIVLSFVFLPRLRRNTNRDVIKAGLVLGVFSFVGFWTQFMGLGWTSPSKNAFLSTCYCLTVPFIWWAVARKRPRAKTFVSAAVCTTGVALVSLEGGLSITPGDAMSILSAFTYGAEIVAIALFMKDHDVICVTIIQQFSAGLLAATLALATHPAPTFEQLANPNLIASFSYVILFSAAFGAIAQNAAQKRITAAEAGLLCSLESVFCALFSTLLFSEVLTMRMVAGFALIFAAVIAVQWQRPSRTEKQADNTA